ncbi:PAAR domain-containing protein [Paraburkholderia sp. 2C]|jgi:uncharacterized Zn-binding protein involved in type VI secretion
MPEQKNDATYFFATLGARTQRGGRVTKVSTHIECDGLAFARVGDIVTCEDGRTGVASQCATAKKFPVSSYFL